MYKSVNPNLGLDEDWDCGTVHLLSMRLLMAVARGEIDANALLKEELAARGYDKDGNWIGFSDDDEDF